MKKITLACSHDGCPRKQKTEWDSNFPEGTVVVKSKCPWHQDGDFDQEQYFDEKGQEIYWSPKE